MSEYITIKQIAKLAKVSEEQAKNMLSMGGAFAMVPRRGDATGNLVIHRKDFMPHLQKKLEQDAQNFITTQEEWDLHFSVPELYDFIK